MVTHASPATSTDASMSRSLLSHSAHQLVAETTAGRVSAVQLLEACQQRVAEVNPALNALVVTRWDEALVEAQQADRAQRAGRTLGPLHGLPVTIKELFDVVGLPTTAGLARRRTLTVTRDADAVRRWRRAGAIVVGKTNVPQMGVLAESDNPLYGRTNNPWDLTRGPGGSSGGEAALIAAGASPLGLGSDGGGSIRQPAHACGVCGFKPTGGRLSMQGHWLSANWPSDWVQPGPMARCVADLQLAYQVLCQPPDAPPVYDAVPGAEGEPTDGSLSGLRVGVFEQFDELPIMSSAARAVREAAEALRREGIDVVPFRFERAGTMWDLYTAIFCAEGLRDMRRQARGSAMDWRVRNYFRLARLPRSLRKPLSRVSRAIGQSRVARVLTVQTRPVMSAEEYCQRLVQMHGLRHHFARRLQRAKLDALLGPASPVPAFPHGELYATYSLMYTGVFNLLGVPAGVVPVTQVRDDELAHTERPRDWVEQSLWRAQRNSAGLPIGVQVIGPWWADERVLALMRALEQRIGFSAMPSGRRDLA
jgi:fatty acid amide hydrolase